MRRSRSFWLERAAALLAAALVLKVVVAVVASYPDYFPPNFRSEFLRGRESHFLGPYLVAFQAHVVSGPVSLVLGLVLISVSFRRRFPAWHRWLGRVQAIVVCAVVAPSGLVMAFHAAGGPLAGVGLAALAIATAACVALGIRAARARRFGDHRRWMGRGLLLLGSAVVLRVLGGAATVAGLSAPWVVPASIWLSWLGPLAMFEWLEWSRGEVGRRGTSRPGRVTSP